MTKNLYWDDLKIGQVYTSGTLVLDKAQIISFAEAFDPQQIGRAHV